MAMRSKRIELYDPHKMQMVNKDTMTLLNKYSIDMELRELSDKTIMSYKSDLNQWVIYILERQDNKCVLDITEDDLTEFFYFCKKEGNNSRRIKRRMASISAFYKYLRKKSNFYGFEINKEFYRRAKEEMCVLPKDNQLSIEDIAI